MNEAPHEQNYTRRRRVLRKPKLSNVQNKDRWLLSYADFITLLFAFFVALYALSIKHSGSKEELSETLNGIFDVVQKSIKPISVGKPIAGEPKETNVVESPRILTAPTATEDDAQNAPSIVFTLLNQVVETQFSDLQQEGQISVSETANWVNVELKSGLLFGEGEYDLTNEAVAILMVIANVLKNYPSVILVDGNTDNLPVTSSRLISNWHLSSLRSSSVVEELVYQGVNPKKIAPIGFSSEHPKVRNTNDDARRQNRRVTLRISKHNADNLYDYLFK